MPWNVSTRKYFHLSENIRHILDFDRVLLISNGCAFNTRVEFNARSNCSHFLKTLVYSFHSGQHIPTVYCTLGINHNLIKKPQQPKHGRGINKEENQPHLIFVYVVKIID